MIKQLITEFPVSDFPRERSISREKITKYAYTKEEVDAMYAKAIELGATDDGEPGPRAGNFYGAYVYDLDGNKLCFFNF